tara:strand:+ start:633 stop:911 length:279 start_codon:yes stop_codon:yes gene_type:complete
MLLELPMTKTPKKPKSTTKTAPNTKHIEYKKLESLCRSQHKFIVSLEKKAEATDKKTRASTKDGLLFTIKSLAGIESGKKLMPNLKLRMRTA